MVLVESVRDRQCADRAAREATTLSLPHRDEAAAVQHLDPLARGACSADDHHRPGRRAPVAQSDRSVASAA